MRTINGQTSIYGIIGQPVTHSLSPLFQNKFIQNSQADAVYIPFPVEPKLVEKALAGLHAAAVAGLNVTIPHKEQVLKLVQADADAHLIGAVNTLKRSEDGWLACNTDWQGFAAVLQGLEADVGQQAVLLFGAGGTSRAICHALSQQGASKVWVCNRGEERAKHLQAHLKQTYPGMKCALLPWDERSVADVVRDCGVVINSSSIGLQAEDVFPFALKGQGVAIDAVYKPDGRTAFCSAARSGGFSVVDGLPMLIAQGIASFAFWHQQGQASFDGGLPEKLQALQWVEQQLKRQPLLLSGWEN